MPDVCVSEKAMARGQQKIQSQQKNAKKAAEKKGQGADQKTAAKAALVYSCPVCRVRRLCDSSYGRRVTGLSSFSEVSLYLRLFLP